MKLILQFLVQKTTMVSVKLVQFPRNITYHSTEMQFAETTLQITPNLILRQSQKSFFSNIDY